MTDVPVLQLVDATMVKNGVRILDHLTLTVRAGEHTAIVGPNGAGKSALMNLLTHHERALASRNGTPAVRVFGDDRWDVFALRSRLGIVSADLHHRSIDGNSTGRIRGDAAVLSGFFASHGVPTHVTVTDARRETAARALARMDAGHLAGKLLNEMSSGEARRVLIARALVTDPQALVLDEPTAGLDLVARHRCMELVRGVARRGTTIVLVTHHIDEIIPEIGRVVLLGRGRVMSDGPKASTLTGARLSEVFEAPVSVEAADGYYRAYVSPPTPAAR